MEEITIYLHAVFIGHGYLQQTGRMRRRKYGFYYPKYLVPQYMKLKDAIIFPQGHSII